MSVQKRGKAYRVRWKEGDSWRSRTFDRKSDANVFDAELRRLRRLGALASLDAGTETLDHYVTHTWAPTYAAALAPKTRALYAGLYDAHISATLGPVRLRELTPELIGRCSLTGSPPVLVRVRCVRRSRCLAASCNVPMRVGGSRRTPLGLSARHRYHAVPKSSLSHRVRSRKCARRRARVTLRCSQCSHTLAYAPAKR